MNLTSLDDAALLSIIAGAHGKPAPVDSPAHGAVSELYDRYGRLIFTIAIHSVGDAETAEEITQDVFLRVWEGAVTYRADVAKVSSWMVSIARHRSIDELRRRGVRPEKFSIEWAEDSDDEARGASPLPVLDSPEETVELAIQRRSIRQAMAQLPDEQRVVLGLAFFKGLSHSQIADQLGEPLGTVKSRIRLAMQKLRDLFFEKGIVDK